ncbi:MAG: aldehyde dehydrogenase family protein [Sandaracinaceae bacterium]|nr:aldehyde dehydrogenase family protein [Sandaracinaceae bacterium]
MGPPKHTALRAVDDRAGARAVERASFRLGPRERGSERCKQRSRGAATTAPPTSASSRRRAPVTGELLGTFRISTKEDVDAAVARARAAFPAWRDTSVRDRLKMLSRIKDVVRTHGEEYARRISEDTGKPLVDSLLTELMSIPLFIDHYRKTAPRVLARKKVSTPILFPGKKSYREHSPMGVVAVISPWNFPFQLSMVPVVSALVAGNTVVLSRARSPRSRARSSTRSSAASACPAASWRWCRATARPARPSARPRSTRSSSRARWPPAARSWRRRRRSPSPSSSSSAARTR